MFFGLEPRWCQILGMCAQGTTALSTMFKEAEKDPYAFPWDKMLGMVAEIYAAEQGLQSAQEFL